MSINLYLKRSVIPPRFFKIRDVKGFLWMLCDRISRFTIDFVDPRLYLPYIILEFLSRTPTLLISRIASFLMYRIVKMSNRKRCRVVSINIKIRRR